MLRRHGYQGPQSLDRSYRGQRRQPDALPLDLRTRHEDATRPIRHGLGRRAGLQHSGSASKYSAWTTGGNDTLSGGAGDDLIYGGRGGTSTGGGNITVKASADIAGGIPPQFDLYVNGVKVGGTVSVTASHATGQWQTISFKAPSDTTSHSKIELRYINDKATSGDRDLFVDYIEVNGTRIEADRALCPVGDDDRHRPPSR